MWRFNTSGCQSLKPLLVVNELRTSCLLVFKTMLRNMYCESLRAIPTITPFQSPVRYHFCLLFHLEENGVDEYRRKECRWVQNGSMCPIVIRLLKLRNKILKECVTYMIPPPNECPIPMTGCSTRKYLNTCKMSRD